jgi:hypothetical protein
MAAYVMSSDNGHKLRGGITYIVDPSMPVGQVKSFSQVEWRPVQWLWKGYLARGEITMLDGEKGAGKSFATIDLAARFTTMRPMPGQKRGIGKPINVIIFTTESSAESETMPRLHAAGADLDRVYCNVVEDSDSHEWSLPDGADYFGDAIKTSKAGLAIFDPINDFLAETINTNNDASIRRALRPIGKVLRDCGCAGMFIRHMNKNTGADAKFRGTGTTAYQNRARIHLIAAAIPDHLSIDSNGSRFGLAVVDNNLRRVDRGVLSYDVTDSEVVQSDEDFVGCIEWGDILDITANELTQRPSKQRGPESVVRNKMEEILREMFAEKDTWHANEAKERWDKAGINYNATQEKKAKENCGVSSFKGRGGDQRWFWTTGPIKVTR